MGGWNKGKHILHSGSFKKGIYQGYGFKKGNQLGKLNKNKPLLEKHKEKLSIIKKRMFQENKLLNLFKKGHLKTSGAFKKGHIGYKGMLGKYQSEEMIQKRKETLLKRYGTLNCGTSFTKETRAKLILPVKDTTIEVKIQNFLKQLGIEYFTHQYMKIEHGYQCDILIPSMNLVIECDGNYWHKYPTRRDIDNIRTKELIEKGFKVLRLWEVEIRKMNINDFEIRLKEAERTT